MEAKELGCVIIWSPLSVTPNYGSFDPQSHNPSHWVTTRRYNKVEVDINLCFQPIRAILEQRAWPGVEEGLSYGTPALKVRGKLLVRLREPDVVVLPCDLDEKEFLKQLAPEVYFETDHYRGYPWILARLSQIDSDELADRIERAWRMHATKKLLAEFDGQTDSLSMDL